MKTFRFRIVPLQTNLAEAARRAAKNGAPDHALVVPDRAGPEAVIARFLEKPETAFVYVRSLSRGCYTMEIQCQ